MSDTDTIRITVDGFPEDVPAGLDLAALLELRGEPAKVTIVEHNGRYVKAGDLPKMKLREGDRVEIILPAFGG